MLLTLWNNSMYRTKVRYIHMHYTHVEVHGDQDRTTWGSGDNLLKELDKPSPQLIIPGFLARESGIEGGEGEGEDEWEGGGEREGRLR
jgi:hypothetical protein